MPEWNPMQLKAIQTKERNILVSASAGSGKTTVLIARLMDLVMKDHVSIDSILAMTFTEAAANEMKKRLATELQKALTAARTEEEKSYITRQLTGIQTAHISTIHSFCLSIIQEYYYILGLDPQRIKSIMDNGTIVLFQQQSLEEAFAKQYQLQDASFLQLCQMFSARAENDEALRTMIMDWPPANPIRKPGWILWQRIIMKSICWRIYQKRFMRISLNISLCKLHVMKKRWSV